jgi:hypothetical protein
VLKRNFSHDDRVQRSFVFKFDYFTIVEHDVQPMPWQQSDRLEKLQNKPPEHIPISRCSSVVALSLCGKPVKKIRNNTRKARKEQNEHGLIYDPWAPVSSLSHAASFVSHVPSTDRTIVACAKHSMLPRS